MSREKSALEKQRGASVGYSVHRFNALAELTTSEAHWLETLGDKPVCHPRGTTIRREGTSDPLLYLLVDGWVASSIGLPNGTRAIQKMHLPGDMLGTPSMILERAADTLTALTDAITSSVPDAKVQEMFSNFPRLTGLFIMAAQTERLALMDALVATGKTFARERLARLLLDLHGRLKPIGLVEDNSFDLPVTQEVLGDLLGLTNVHVNRTVRAMTEEGLIELRHRRMILKDLPGLARISPIPNREIRFEPSWLPPRPAD